MSHRVEFLIIAASCLFFAPMRSPAGEFFKWVDKKGEVHYSDSKAGAAAAGKAAEEKSFNNNNYNITPPVVWPASIFSEDEREEFNKKDGNQAKERAGSLPWFTESNFESEVLSARGLTLVEFWAKWCGICRKVDPIINDIAGQYGSKVKFGRVDIDHDKRLENEYKVRGVPNLVFFKDGKVVGRLVGGFSKDSYVRMIESKLR